MIAVLALHLRLPMCASLKEKRGRIQPLMARLRREFNISVAEMDKQDEWEESVIACAMIGGSAAVLQASMQSVEKWVEANWSHGDVWDTKIEIM
ncbi:MAG: DUF503 domain-containing protein [Anaerolineales bacterium]